MFSEPDPSFRLDVSAMEHGRGFGAAHAEFIEHFAARDDLVCGRPLFGWDGVPLVMMDAACTRCGSRYPVRALMRRSGDRRKRRQFYGLPLGDAVAWFRDWSCSSQHCRRQALLEHASRVVSDLSLDSISLSAPNVADNLPSKRLGDLHGRVGFTVSCQLCSSVHLRSLAELVAGDLCACRVEPLGMSAGEAAVAAWLDAQHIPYRYECSFASLGLGDKQARALRFDFYLPLQSVAIEYDGEQHFRPVEHFGGKEGFSRRLLNEVAKEAFAHAAGIKVLRVPYTEPDVGRFLRDQMAGLGVMPW
ncbi:hypothetical protein KDW98_32420 [Burkholderia vietnamiensis]|uniref:hypothetical protein n=1 Tax=Burkholderia vietnamiensis TaxID=60552 RepID=UPI001B9DE8A6|nr:hypothetical protein [Burkholderia vietnamiensis]MBR8165839.1 hypothetical protein [Burkholderia vietnamiensis]